MEYQLGTLGDSWKHEQRRESIRVGRCPELKPGEEVFLWYYGTWIPCRYKRRLPGGVYLCVSVNGRGPGVEYICSANTFGGKLNAK